LQDLIKGIFMEFEAKCRKGLVVWGLYCVVIGTSMLLGGCDANPKAEKAEQPAAAEATKRVSFDQLFEVNGNSVKPKTVVRYSGTTFTPDVPFEVQVVTLNNEPFSQIVGRDAEVRIERGVTEILKFY
jgi:hypothetical protein